MLKGHTLAIFWTLILLPTLIVCFYEITDNFNYRTVAFIKYYRDVPTLPIYEETPFKISIGSGVRAHPLHEIHFLIIERVLGLDAKVFQNFPLGVTLIVLLYTMILMLYNPPSYTARALYLVPFISFVYTSPLMGTYIPTYGFILLLALLILLYKHYYYRKYEQGSLLAGLTLAIALNFIYYTAYVALISIIALKLLINLLTGYKSREIGRGAVILLILLMLFSFNELIYETIEKITLNQGWDFNLNLAILRVLGKLLGDIKVEQDPYVFIIRASWYYSIFNIARVVSVISITIAFSLVIAYKLLADIKMLSTNPVLMFVATFSMMPITVMIIYIIYGGFPRYDLFFFVYPVVVPAMFTNFGFKRLRKIFMVWAIIAMAVSVMTYAFFLIEDKVVLFPYSYNDASYASYYLSLSGWTSKIRVLSDFRTIGIFTVLLAENGITLHPVFFSSDVYDVLLKGNITNKEVDFIIINKRLADRPVTSVFWNYYHPLEPFINGIIQAYELIYNDNFLYMLNPIPRS